MATIDAEAGEVAATIADLQAAKDAKNAPPEGISRKAWGAMKNGWIPDPGTPMWEKWICYVASDEQLAELGLIRVGEVIDKAPPTPPETVAAAFKIGLLLTAAAGLVWYLAGLFDTNPQHKMAQHCLPKLGREYQQGCTEWTAGGNQRVPLIDQWRDHQPGNNYNPGEYGKHDAR